MPDQGDEVPDLYADAFQVTITAFGGNLTFSRREAHPVATRQQVLKELVTVRMSVEHLKVMTMMLRRQVKEYEEHVGSPIRMAPELYQQLGIAEEDWGI